MGIEITDLLIDLAEELVEIKEAEEVHMIGDAWCYIVDNVLYTRLQPGLGKEILAISSEPQNEKVGIPYILDGNPDHILDLSHCEVRVSLMYVFNNLCRLATPA